MDASGNQIDLRPSQVQRPTANTATITWDASTTGSVVVIAAGSSTNGAIGDGSCTVMGGTINCATSGVFGAALTFAGLAALVTNGSIAYCSDCAVSSGACAGGGMGAFVLRINGANRCLAP
jgi:hypothetical protein